MTTSATARASGYAAFAGVRAWEPVEYVDLSRDSERLSKGGFWVVAARFEGRLDAWRMARVEHSPQPVCGREWRGPDERSWSTSLDRQAYRAGVARIRERIREGDVYQVNLCRMLEAPLPAGALGPDADALADRLATGNPARFASRMVMPAAGADPGVWIVSASPELYLDIDGSTVRSSPIKGTAAPGEEMLPKDESENVMITDLIRNDLSHVAVPGSVHVPEFLAHHELPGLVHLQSTVEAALAPGFRWNDALWPALMEGTFPPGSVSGAPKHAALQIIRDLEPVERGAYCGGIGWIDVDAHRAQLAVGIRTFEWEPRDGGVLRFGTGAGITWESDPQGEWEETELKARRLIRLASKATLWA